MTQEEHKEQQTKSKVQKNVKQMLVRYGRMGLMGWFEHHENHIPKTERYVIIKTERGLELGELVGPYYYKSGHFRSSPDQVDAYYTQGDKEFTITTGGRFVRFAKHEDIREQEHLEASAINEAKCCQKIAKELNLEMKVIEAEHLFGGERIIFYFTSDGRVDFRELVKRLAKEYQTRIELRQIGSRDEARLISDYESCGQQCCCKRFLKILEPVNMRMAKLQKATLDPSKISGHCGRLKCCLRYEDQTYRQLKSALPSKNTLVQTPKGIGKVVDMQVLTQLVVVLMENGERQAWRVDEIQKALNRPPAGKEKVPKEQAPKEKPAQQKDSKDKPQESPFPEEENRQPISTMEQELDEILDESRQLQKSEFQPDSSESKDKISPESSGQENRPNQQRGNKRRGRKRNHRNQQKKPNGPNTANSQKPNQKKKRRRRRPPKQSGKGSGNPSKPTEGKG